LPAPGIPELQQAAQSIEEPLIRLKYQLLWFDFERDPRGETLVALLRAPSGAAIREYLTSRPPVPEPEPLLALESSAEPIAPAESDGAAQSDNGSSHGHTHQDQSIIAQALNQANLRLLLVGARINGIFVEPPSRVALQRLSDAESWQTLRGF